MRPRYSVRTGEAESHPDVVDYGGELLRTGFLDRRRVIAGRLPCLRPGPREGCAAFRVDVLPDVPGSHMRTMTSNTPDRRRVGTAPSVGRG